MTKSEHFAQYLNRYRHFVTTLPKIFEAWGRISVEGRRNYFIDFEEGFTVRRALRRADSAVAELDVQLEAHRDAFVKLGYDFDTELNHFK